MNIPPFLLERIQSLYENTVEYNLTESGFHPFTLEELLSPDELKLIQSTVLGYGQTNGSIPLREAIAALYESCDSEHVLVTNGSAEANFVACHTLLDKGDEVIMMVPNYMQIWGIAAEMDCQLKAFHLKEENNWAPDLDELERLSSPNTKMIVICNPNNPTGYTLTSAEMNRIIDIAKKNDAWIFSDEIYRGAELNGVEIESFYGKYDKVMVNGGLSKAYALPGLRLGWLVGPKQLIEDSWGYHDYTSITAGILSHKVGEIALQPEKRLQILNRNRKMLNENLLVLQEWLAEKGDFFHFIPPKAGGMSFVRYHAPGVNSTDLSDWLRLNKSVFIVPGDCYGMDGYFRLGIGERKHFLLEGLERLRTGIEEYLQLH
ncbi:MAG: aminotransferase class I/II-fold pyridoxal phosphate-dependent enzyme [Saprospiraceae bacterium]|nr:aminotransferase class I/II-fold pyridoxal phosphate-dependent enzyme [Saprospiraceae bacterium]